VESNKFQYSIINPVGFKSKFFLPFVIPA
jgi:hypothetical protein